MQNYLMVKIHWNLMVNDGGSNPPLIRVGAAGLYSRDDYASRLQ